MEEVMHNLLGESLRLMTGHIIMPSQEILRLKHWMRLSKVPFFLMTKWF